MAYVKRPAIITVISVFLVLGSLVSFFYLFSPSVKRLGSFIPAILGVIITLQFVSVIGLWHMKRWGLHLYLAGFFIRFISFYLLGIFSFYQGFCCVFMIFYTAIFMVYYRRMDINL